MPPAEQKLRATAEYGNPYWRPDGTNKRLILWWAVLGSNQWPLQCETEFGGLQINHMHMRPPGDQLHRHLASRDVTRFHAMSRSCCEQTVDVWRASNVALQGNGRTAAAADCGDGFCCALLVRRAVHGHGRTSSAYRSAMALPMPRADPVIKRLCLSMSSLM